MGCPLRATRISSKNEVFYFIKNDKKRRIFVFIMAIAIVALLAFGGSYAYFTATATEGVATLTTGKVTLTGGASNTVTLTNVMPKDELYAKSAVKFNTGDSSEATYVAVRITVKSVAKNASAEDITAATALTAEECAALGLSFAAATTWTETATGSGIFVNTNAVAAATDAVFNSEAALVFNCEENNSEDVADTALLLMDRKIIITFEGFSVQSKSFTNPSATDLWTAMQSTQD